MRYVDMLDAWLAGFDFTSPFQIVVILLVLFKIYTLQVSEKLDLLVERTPYRYGWFRRAATVSESVMWLWVIIYLYEENLAPRPPGFFLALSYFINVIAGLVIVHADYCRARRLGMHVASLSDALPSIRQSAAKSEGRQSTR
jgi:hypothetical protein